MLDPTKRFSNRVEDYVKYRPHYPAGVLDLLREECGFTAEWVVADLGAGTGILTELLLGNGNRVFAVEPNAEMRHAAEERLGGTPGYVSVAGRAEATTLADACVEMVTAGQASHWFDREKTPPELRRILKPGGWVALIDNRHVRDEAGLHDALEALLTEHSAEHREMREIEAHSDENASDFFGAGGYVTRTCSNRQVVDLDGFVGRNLSRSTTPAEGQAGHEEVMAGLRRLFDEYNEGGRIVFEYETKVRVGRAE